MDKEKFKELCKSNLIKPNISIGMLAEKRLHRVLKNYYEPDINKQEIKVEGFVVDIKNDNEIIEIQTQNFNQLRNKLTTLLPNYHITIVYPIAAIKWLGWINPNTGEVTKLRKSPKTGTFCDAFKELYKIKWMLLDNNLKITLLLLEIEELRNLDGWSKDHKKGSTRHERIPLDLYSELTLNEVQSYQNLIPKTLPIFFTTKDFARVTHLTSRRTQEAINVLFYLGAINRVGKKGNTYLYQKAGDKNEI